MASILVVGQEQRSLERFHRVLSGEGWRVRLAEGRAQALQAAALEPPDLVVAGADVPGADELAGAFRRSSGGPGIVVVMSEAGTASGPAVLGDDRLRQPFGDQDLVTAVRRMLAAGTGASRPVAPPVRLTSQEIFGDVLAEVEGQFGQPGSTVTGQAAAPAPAALASPPAAPAAGPGPSAPAARPSPAASRADSEIQRKLEKTLSGLMGGDPRSKAAGSPAAAGTAASAHPGRRAESGGAAEIEALLSKTLSELGGARPRHPQPATSPAAAPAAPAAADSAGPAAAASASPAAAAAGATRSAAAPAPPAPASPTAVPPAGIIAGPSVLAAPPAPPTPTAPPVTFDRRAVATAAPASLAPPPPPPPLPPIPSSSEASGAPAGSRDAGVASAAAGAAPSAPPGDVAAPTRPASAAAAGDATGVRRRLTGEMALSQIEELARTRRKVEPSSRPGLAVPPAPVAAPAGALAGSPASPALPAPPPAATSGANPLATQRIQAVPRERPEPAGERFGQYTLLERIAVGGMAEVWKARMRGVEGFQKTVAIKKILPHMTDNAEFVSMFIDEAKLAAQLSHPNIIHIYDLGKIGSDFYIAMEYVEGKDLRSLLNAARQRGKPLPLGLALLVAMRLASALDYAHRKRDFEGHVMGLVHRDVSPQNVLISYDGDVKLCDFGIAKAVSKVGQTQMGALKGKLQYMSPEQARGTQVDARSDIFSLGTVLFEMLTGQRLFDGDSEMSVLEAVRQVRVRSPRQVDPAIPREVDELVMHALAGRPEDRFQTAGELEQRLEALLYALKPSPSHGDLAAYVQRVLEPVVMPAAPAAAPAALTGSRPGRTPASAAFQPAGKAPPAASLPGAAPSLPPPPPKVAAPAPGSYAAAGAAATTAAASAAAAAPAPSASPEVAPLAPLGEVRMEEGSRRGRTMLAAAVLALVVAGVALFFVMRGRNASAPGGAPPATGTRASSPVAAGGNAAGVAASAAATKGMPQAAGAQGAASRPAAGKVDVQGVVDQEVARHAEELKKKLEEQQKQLQKELDKTKSAKAENGNGTPAGAAATAGAAGAPAPGAGPATTKAALTPATSTGSGAAAAAGHGQPPPPVAPAAETRKAAAEPAASSAPAATAASSAGAPEAARERASEPSGRSAADAGAGSAGAGSASRATPVASVVIVPPKLVSTPKPEYPPLARKLGVQGTVVLQVLVDEQGNVEDVQVLEAISQSVGINEAAVQVARGARFKPGTRNGDRAKMWTRLRIPFKL